MSSRRTPGAVVEIAHTSAHLPGDVGGTTSSPDSSVTSSTPAPASVVEATSSTKDPKISGGSPTGEAEVTSSSPDGVPWNFGAVETSADKNPFSALTEEDIIRIQSVLSTEEGKKIIQQTSLTDMDPTTKPESETMETQSDDDIEEDIPLELDEEMATQFLQEGIKESYLVDLFSDHAYSATSAVDQSDNPVNSSLELIDSTDTQGEASSQGSVEEPPTSTSRRAPVVRRSTRIQDLEQREMAEKIRQEYIQSQREAQSQSEDDNKQTAQKQYNMRTKRPQRDDGRIDFPRRGRGGRSARGRTDSGPSREVKNADEDEGDAKSDKAENDETQSVGETSDAESKPMSSGPSTPRRSSRPPKKKSWLIELEKGRESRDESARESPEEEEDEDQEESEKSGESDTEVHQKAARGRHVASKGRRGEGQKATVASKRGRGRKAVNVGERDANPASDSDSSDDDIPLTALKNLMPVTRGRGKGRGRGRGGKVQGGRKVGKVGKDLSEEEGRNTQRDAEESELTDSDDDGVPLGDLRTVKTPPKSRGQGKGAATHSQPSRRRSSKDLAPTKPTRKPRRVRGTKNKEDDEDAESSSMEEGSGSDESNDSDSAWNSEDDPDRLWCICKKPFNNRFMINCDKCKEWYHGSCVGVTRKQGKEIARTNAQWSCPGCLKGHKKYERRNSRSASQTSLTKEDEDNVMKAESSTKEVPSKASDEEGDLFMECTEDDPEPVQTEPMEIPPPKTKPETGKTRAAQVEEEELSDSDEEYRQPSLDEDEEDESDTWNARKKDSELKLQQLQEKLKALKDKKTKSDEADEKKKSKTPAFNAPSADEKKKSLPTPPSQTFSRKARCTNAGCGRVVMPGSVYCSEDCIAKYADESLDLIRQERERVYGSRHGEAGVVERVVVMERKTGKILTGPAAPTEVTLHSWLDKHPSFEVLRPGQAQTASSIKKKEELPKKKQEVKKPDAKKSEPSSKDKKTSSSTSDKRESSKSSSSSHEKSSARDSDRHRAEKRERERKEKEREKAHEKKERSDVKKLEISPPSSAPNPVRIGVRKALKDYLSKRAEDADDIMLSASEIKRVAVDIEEELYKFYGDVNSKYKHKFKYILINIKDSKNKGLFRRILNLEISPKSLVRMSSEKLGSKELAQWKERNVALEGLDFLEDTDATPVKSQPPSSPLQSPPVTVSSLPRIPKKPPGASLVEEKKPVKPYEDPGHDFLSGFMFDTTAQHKNHLFDVNCKICTGKIAAGPESNQNSNTDTEKKVKFSSNVTKKTITPEKEPKMTSLFDIKFDDVPPLQIHIDGDDDPKPIRDFKLESPDMKHEDQMGFTWRHPKDFKDSKPRASFSDRPVSHLQKSEPMGESHPVTGRRKDSEPVNWEPEDVKPLTTGSTTIRDPPHSRSQPTGAEKTHEQLKAPKIPPSPHGVKSNLPIQPPPMPTPGLWGPVKLPNKPAPVWKGFLNAQDLAKFPAKAYCVSGNMDMIKEDLPETISIMGRLPPDNVYDYLGRLKTSHTSNREICVLSFHPSTNDDKSAYIALYTYLNGRNRCGVVGAMGKTIKDLYIVPLPSKADIPSVLTPFSGPGLPVPRSHMLLCLIVKAKPRRHHSDAHGSKVPAKTWMYSERPAGEPAGKSPIKVPGAIDPGAPPTIPLEKSAQPPLPPNIPPPPQPVATEAPPVPLPSTAADSKAAPGSESEEDDELSEELLQIKDPIVQQYAKAKPRASGLAAEPQPEAPADEPYDPFADYMSPDINEGPDFDVPEESPIRPAQAASTAATKTATATVPVSAPTTVITAATPNAPTPNIFGKVLDEMSKAKTPSQMTAAMIATLAASSSTRSLDEQRMLLLQLNQKVEEQRLAVERQKEEALKRTKSLEQLASEKAAMEALNSAADEDGTTWAKPPSQESEGKAAEKSPCVTSNKPVTSSAGPSSGNSIVPSTSSGQLNDLPEMVTSNIARKRLAQKITAPGEPTGPAFASPSPNPALNESINKLPPALQALLTGSSLEHLKQIVSTATGKQAGETGSKTSSQAEDDELEAALNNPGGRQAPLGQQPVKGESEKDAKEHEKVEDEDIDYMLSLEDTDSGKHKTTGLVEAPQMPENMASIPGLGLEDEELSQTGSKEGTSQLPDWAANLPKKDSNSKGGNVGSLSPSWIQAVRQKIAEKQSPKGGESLRSTSKEPQSETERKTLSRERSPGRSSRYDRGRSQRSSRRRSRSHSRERRNRSRDRDSKRSSRSKSVTAEEDLEEGEIPDHAAVESDAASQKSASKDLSQTLQEIPLPDELPPIPEKSSSEGDKQKGKPDNSSMRDTKKSSDSKPSPRRRRSHSQSKDQRRRRSRSRSRDRRRRSRSRNRRNRSRSRDRRRSRRSRSKDKKRSRSKSPLRSSRRGRSKDRSQAPKRRRSPSKDDKKSETNSNQKSPEKKAKISDADKNVDKNTQRETIGKTFENLRKLAEPSDDIQPLLPGLRGDEDTRKVWIRSKPDERDSKPVTRRGYPGRNDMDTTGKLDKEELRMGPNLEQFQSLQPCMEREVVDSRNTPSPLTRLGPMRPPPFSRDQGGVFSENSQRSMILGPSQHQAADSSFLQRQEALARPGLLGPPPTIFDYDYDGQIETSMEEPRVVEYDHSAEQKMNVHEGDQFGSRFGPSDLPQQRGSLKGETRGGFGRSNFDDFGQRDKEPPTFGNRSQHDLPIHKKLGPGGAEDDRFVQPLFHIGPLSPEQEEKFLREGAPAERLQSQSTFPPPLSSYSSEPKFSSTMSSSLGSASSFKEKFSTIFKDNSLFSRKLALLPTPDTAPLPVDDLSKTEQDIDNLAPTPEPTPWNRSGSDVRFISWQNEQDGNSGGSQFPTDRLPPFRSSSDQGLMSRLKDAPEHKVVDSMNPFSNSAPGRHDGPPLGPFRGRGRGRGNFSGNQRHPDFERRGFGEQRPPRQKDVVLSGFGVIAKQNSGPGSDRSADLPRRSAMERNKPTEKPSGATKPGGGGPTQDNRRETAGPDRSSSTRKVNLDKPKPDVATREQKETAKRPTASESVGKPAQNNRRETTGVDRSPSTRKVNLDKPKQNESTKEQNETGKRSTDSEGVGNFAQNNRRETTGLDRSPSTRKVNLDKPKQNESTKEQKETGKRPAPSESDDARQSVRDNDPDHIAAKRPKVEESNTKDSAVPKNSNESNMTKGTKSTDRKVESETVKSQSATESTTPKASVPQSPGSVPATSKAGAGSKEIGSNSASKPPMPSATSDSRNGGSDNKTQSSTTADRNTQPTAAEKKPPQIPSQEKDMKPYKVYMEEKKPAETQHSAGPSQSSDIDHRRDTQKKSHPHSDRKIGPNQSRSDRQQSNSQRDPPPQEQQEHRNLSSVSRDQRDNRRGSPLLRDPPGQRQSREPHPVTDRRPGRDRREPSDQNVGRLEDVDHRRHDHRFPPHPRFDHGERSDERSPHQDDPADRRRHGHPSRNNAPFDQRENEPRMPRHGRAFLSGGDEPMMPPERRRPFARDDHDVNPMKLLNLSLGASELRQDDSMVTSQYRGSGSNWNPRPGDPFELEQFHERDDWGPLVEGHLEDLGGDEWGDRDFREEHWGSGNRGPREPPVTHFRRDPAIDFEDDVGRYDQDFERDLLQDVIEHDSHFSRSMPPGGRGRGRNQGPGFRGRGGLLPVPPNLRHQQDWRSSSQPRRGGKPPHFGRR